MWEFAGVDCGFESSEQRVVSRLRMVSKVGREGAADMRPRDIARSAERPLMTDMERRSGSRIGARYSWVKVAAPARVGYMKIRVPLLGDNSIRRSTRIEGPELSNMVWNSLVEVGGT